MDREVLYRLFFKAIGGVYIPRGLRAERGPFLVHASDIPSSAYPALAKALEGTRAAWIALSGDLVDEVKLELNPSLARRYRSGLEHLAWALKPALARGSRLVIAVGNHDEEAAIAEVFPDALRFGTVGTFEAGGVVFGLSHWWRSAFDSGADYLLYGHDVSSPTRLEGGKVYLNGVEAINVVNLATKDLFFLPYPAGTDDERLKRGKIGI